MAPRILTITLNPTVDVAADAPAVQPVRKIRTTNESFDPGGGGVNVSRVLQALGGETLALVLAGGVTGHLLAELLTEAGLPHRAIPIHGRTRMSHTVHDLAAGLEYRFVPEGPALEAGEWQAALAALENEAADWVVGSGSLPPGAPADSTPGRRASPPGVGSASSSIPRARRCGRRSMPGARGRSR
ncbi:1-phosphofructokinase family hexose kinase [Paeniroseomonas aquatica]|uniref:1-phosphofructokinase family hexose kinase n=1 Tax=Paeniroseomonas aquatica TaxID=373043 RepID=UPI00360661AE